MDYVISSVIGYLIGSVPFALVIGKVFYGKDVRNYGSGNLGGSNAGRTLGKAAGITVSLCDVLKATMAMTVIYFIYNTQPTMILAGFFATIGHCFPLFAKFKGGKAVSTAFGFLLGAVIFITHNIFDLIVPLAIFFIALYLCKMVSLSAIIAMVSGSLYLFFTQTNYLLTLAFTIIAIIVISRHKGNIERIKKGEERKITWM